jgi:hypothetical protein
MIRRSNKIVPKVAREYIVPWWRCFSGIAELLDQMEIAAGSRILYQQSPSEIASAVPGTRQVA